MVFNRPAIKKEARAFIGENSRWVNMFLAGLLVALPSMALSSFNGIRAFISALTDNIAFGGSSFATVVAIALMPFGVGLAGYYLMQLRGTETDPTTPYKLGAANYGKFLGVSILVNLFTFLWSLLFIIPGIVMAIAYSMTTYIINDNPNLSATDAIDLSKRITKGYKADLFILGLSFILWGIGCAFTCGILAIYVGPYTKTVQAMYYENLKKNAIDTGIATPAEFGIVETYDEVVSANPDGYWSATQPVAPVVEAAPVAEEVKAEEPAINEATETVEAVAEENITETKDSEE